jgi:hypothetical protein
MGKLLAMKFPAIVVPSLQLKLYPNVSTPFLCYDIAL